MSNESMMQNAKRNKRKTTPSSSTKSNPKKRNAITTKTPKKSKEKIKLHHQNNLSNQLNTKKDTPRGINKNHLPQRPITKGPPIQIANVNDISKPLPINKTTANDLSDSSTESHQQRRTKYTRGTRHRNDSSCTRQLIL